MVAFFHLFSQHLFDSHYVPGTILGTDNAAGNKTVTISRKLKF